MQKQTNKTQLQQHEWMSETGMEKKKPVRGQSENKFSEVAEQATKSLLRGATSGGSSVCGRNALTGRNKGSPECPI
jgi:hypothetical protein